MTHFEDKLRELASAVNAQTFEEAESYSRTKVTADFLNFVHCEAMLLVADVLAASRKLPAYAYGTIDEDSHEMIVKRDDIVALQIAHAALDAHTQKETPHDNS